MKEKILILDDEIMITATLSTLIKMMTKFDVIAENDPEKALEHLATQKVDMIISDFMMPGMNGLDFLKKAKEKNPGAVTVLLTGYADKENAIKSINEVGLYYYLEKPWDNAGLLKIVQNGIEKSNLVKELQNKITELEKSHAEIEKSNAEIERMYDLLKNDFVKEAENVRSIIITMANLIEAKDRYTDGHTRRVGNISCAIAKEMGMSSEELQNIEIAAIIHDIGKVGIPETILNKPGKLDDSEYEIMKTHTTMGEMICKPLASMKDCLDPVRHHHEKLNGTGYPDALKGDEIGIGARIISVADIFDALYSDRPYRQKMELEKVRDIMYTEVRNGALDGNIVDILFNLIDTKMLDEVING